MSLLKRIGFAVFIMLALLGAVWGYMTLKKSKKPKQEAVSVLPDGCMLYLTTPDFFELYKKLNSQNLLVDKLKLFKQIHNLCGMLQAADSLAGSSELLKEEITGNRMHFALYQDLHWLLGFNVKQLGDQQQVASQFIDVFHAAKAGDEMYTFRITPAQPLYFTLSSGIVLVSDAKETIELALDRSSPKLLQNKSFTEFKSTLEEDSPLCLYIDHKLYAQSSAASRLNLSPVFKNVRSAGMVDLEPSQIAVNGFSACDSSEVISLLSHQEAQPADFVSQLPASAVSFTAYGFSSFAEVQQHRTRFFPSRAAQFWREANDSALYNLETEFYDNAGTCLVTFETNAKERLTVLRIADTLKVKEQLPFMTDSVLSKQPFAIYSLKDAGGEALRLFSPFTSAATGYVALYRDCLFFSETAAALSKTLNDLASGHLLISNESFASYRSQHFPEEFNFLIYCSPSQMGEEMPHVLNFDIAADKQPYRNFKHFSFCVTNHASQFKFRWHLLNEAETASSDPNVLWSVDLEHPASSSSYTFANHLTNENELVVQDDENELYLVNAKGTVIWRKGINEKILSPVFTVDMFRNGKYQLLFNTANYIHLLDRNGKYVKGYPVKLTSEACGALSLFDYDNDKDYRLFVSCRNKKIYNYGISGAMQEGFAPVSTDSEVDLPIQYVKVGQSDYLVAVDREGKIYTFSRRGAGRIGLKNRTTENCTAFYVDATNNINSTFLVYVDDKNGLISKISFTDKKEIVKLGPDMSNAHLNFALVDGNRNMDLVFSKDNYIGAYDLNGNLLVEQHPGGTPGKAGFYSDESRSLFYAQNGADNILLVDQASGKTTSCKATALPLICDLFRDNKKYMVLTNGRRLNCVPLN